MPFCRRTISRTKAGALVCAALCVQLIHGQTPERPNRQDQPDVLVVRTELVQTDVMVFDKQGQFVSGLKREDFELRIDGKAKPIEFFEKIITGSVNEELQIAAARGRAPATASASSRSPRPLDRGRPLYFYIDDLHLDLQNVANTRKLILNFIDKEMAQNDELAIASATGQIGFLSQLTDNKAVLRAAVERLKHRPYSVRDFETPRMTEHQALLISNHDRDVTDYFVEQLIRNNPGLSRETAEQMVRTRANGILRQAASITANTLIGLEGLVKSTSLLPGRKVVFFISQGFFLDDQNGDARDRVRRITTAAARNGVVIYSIDARGLVSGLPDASESPFDTSGRLSLAAGGEIAASQDGLNALAADSGGRAFFNSNAMEPAVKRAMEETATYYLLAWKPDPNSTRPNKFHRIEVKVTGRPDLTVQVRRGFFDLAPEPAERVAQKETAANKVEAEFRKLIAAPYPRRDVPVSLRLGFVNTQDKGDMLFATVEIPTQFLSFKSEAGKNTAVVTLLGTIYNETGAPGARFSKTITISARSLDASTDYENLVYSYPVTLKPGLYQARVAARDDQSGRAGSVHEWIEVPNVGAGQLALSSVLMGARQQSDVNNASADSLGFSSTELKTGNRFSRNDFLRFLVFVYNATAATGSTPDVAIQIQIVRDDQPVVTAPLKKLSLEGVEDLKRIPYAAEVSLQGLPAGRYMMQISVVDRVAKTSATQQTRFDIE